MRCGCTSGCFPNRGQCGSAPVRRQALRSAPVRRHGAFGANVRRVRRRSAPPSTFGAKPRFYWFSQWFLHASTQASWTGFGILCTQLVLFWGPQVDIVDTESIVCFRRCSTGRTAPVQKDAHLIADGGILQCGEVGTRTCVVPCRVADSTIADTASDVCTGQEASSAVQPTLHMWRT